MAIAILVVVVIAAILGLAALPATDGKKDPNVVLAVQVKSESDANKGLDKLLANEDDKPGRAFSNGYVLLADSQPA